MSGRGEDRKALYGDDADTDLRRRVEDLEKGRGAAHPVLVERISDCERALLVILGGNVLKENEALKAIEDQCRTTDLEANGCRLDTIIREFLHDQGYKRLAEAMDTVDCWRA